MKRYNFTNLLFLFKIQSMIRRIYLILFLVVFAACDDGDVISTDLEFSQQLERCDNFEASYLIFDTREDPSESLSLILPKDEDTELLFTEPTPEDMPEIRTINENTIRFNYRRYNRVLQTNDLCSIIPPANLDITGDFEAPSGQIIITVTIDDDDNDGIPSEDEGRDPNGDGDFSDAIDTDSDGIADYLDEDDDNDNIKTINEDDNFDGDANPFTNAKNTDGDMLPNYLDPDDDDDGIPTRLEDENEDGIPQNDLVVDAEGINIARYLYNLATDIYTDPGSVANEYQRTVFTTFLVINVNLGPISATEIEFGTYTNVIDNYSPPED